MASCVAVQFLRRASSGCVEAGAAAAGGGGGGACDDESLERSGSARPGTIDDAVDEGVGPVVWAAAPPPDPVDCDVGCTDRGTTRRDMLMLGR